MTCSHVAYEIHKYQKQQNVQQYVYHRPAHGAGVEGHQSPYLALGDYTMMQRNMCFSEEPGLYDPERGCGFNWSDTIVVGVGVGLPHESRPVLDGVVLAQIVGGGSRVSAPCRPIAGRVT